MIKAVAHTQRTIARSTMMLSAAFEKIACRILYEGYLTVNDYHHVECSHGPRTGCKPRSSR
jgi:hypothetical protein